jgi:hypothetical protein
MSDEEFVATAESILRKARSSCLHLLDLVDLLGQDAAFRMVQADVAYPRELMVRMLLAARSGTDAELFSIAKEVSACWK